MSLAFESSDKFLRRLAEFSIDNAVDLLASLKPADLHILIRSQATGNKAGMKGVLMKAMARKK